MKRTLRLRRWAPSIAAVAAFGTLGATCAYWALQLLAPPVAIAPTGSLVDTQSVPDLAAAQSLFGSSASAPVTAGAISSEIRVLGVAASAMRGSAVLVVDAGAPGAFLVGDEVGPGLRLVEVRSDAAVLERNGARIELPAPQRPSIRLLSSGQVAPETAPRADREIAATAPSPSPSPRSAAAAGVVPLSGIRPGSARTLEIPARAPAND